MEGEMSNPDADQFVHAIATNWSSADLTPPDRSLGTLASQLTTGPHQMSEVHVLDLKRNGFNEAAIHDAVQIVGYFNYINRLANGLDVDLEVNIHEWENSLPKRD